MTRIIGGSAGGRRLRTPPGEATRPTSDRVREALFSALEAQLGSLGGTAFLDLYAGSGAIGLEALSRGASSATAVESDRRAAAVASDNARTIGFALDVRARAVASVLATTPRAAYDAVFADPPYPLSNSDLESVLALLVPHGWLADGAVVVVERSSRTAEPQWPQGLVRERAKEYGETVLWYLRAEPDRSGPPSV